MIEYPFDREKLSQFCPDLVMREPIPRQHWYVARLDEERWAISDGWMFYYRAGARGIGMPIASNCDLTRYATMRHETLTPVAPVTIVEDSVGYCTVAFEHPEYPGRVLVDAHYASWMLRRFGILYALADYNFFSGDPVDRVLIALDDEDNVVAGVAPNEFIPTRGAHDAR